MKILLTGVPGSGKTTVGEYLAQKHGLYHQDMEQSDFEPIRQAKVDLAEFLERLNTHKDIVVTWGFGPVTDRTIIEALLTDGYTFFWFDGDRIASFRNFMHREKHNDMMEFAYYRQMIDIVASRIVDQLNPHSINPFSDNGEFRPIEEIAQEIIHTASS